MQPSQYEIQREVEALRDIRRRSTSQGGPGALILDPDLPNPAAQIPSTHWSNDPSPPPTDGDPSENPHDPDTSSSGASVSSPADDPFHLFWVPANLHPEIAPAEFRAFLKEHARGPLANGAPGTLERSNSLASASSLGRKRSMLSRQYKPSENDGVEDEKVVPLRRNRSVFSNQGPQLTMSDLQRLEELAEEASVSDDPSKLRTMLRRSLSLNMPPSAVDQMDDAPDLGDEANLPIIVPPPGQILRRAARTKIRKPSLIGDGGGHRFQATRRGTRGPPPPVPSMSPEQTQRLSADTSSSEHHTDPSDAPTRVRTFSNESLDSDNYKHDTLSDEPLSIYEPHTKGEEEEMKTPITLVSPPPVTVDIPVALPPPDIESPQSAPPVLHHPQPQRPSLAAPQSRKASRSTSPDHASPAPSMEPATSRSPPKHDPTSFAPASPSPQRKGEGKKGLFGKWGSDKDKKKGNKDKERENQRVAEKEKEKEKDSGFFGSLFGGKKKQDESTAQGLGHGASGRDLGAIGASKSSKSYVPPTSPSLAGVNGSYARYPIHVERAIYRLSHIKLANPRRPLYEQVLISNLMFWYLGVINKTQNPSSPPSTPASGGQANAEKEQKEKEAKEKAEQEKVEKERLEKEREKERVVEQKREPRRGSLTKTPSAGSPGSGRRAAETPVKGPQYEMQHRVMEQEYGGFSGQSSNSGHGTGQPMGRSVSSPTTGMGGQPRNQQQLPHIPRNYFANRDVGDPDSEYEEQIPNQHRPSSPQLPPGAMAPVSTEQQSWLSPTTPSSPQSPRPRVPSSPSPPPAASTSSPPSGYPNPRRSRSPPPPNQQPLVQNRYTSGPQPEKHILTGQGGGRLPGRSQSVTSAPSQPLSTRVNGGLKKGNSAHATVRPPIPNGRRQTTSEDAREEEDLPLGLWQQRQRR